MIFEYSNSWNSPRFWLSPNIGDVVGVLSLSHGLSLLEYSQNLSLTRSIGSFMVSGDIEDICIFGKRLESDYSKYLTLQSTDWDHYKKLASN